MSEKTEQGLVAQLVEALHDVRTAWLAVPEDVQVPDEVNRPELWEAVEKALARATPEAVRKADAAPELYGALRQALNESGCDGDLCAHRWHDTARTAIAKAEGRS